MLSHGLQSLSCTLTPGAKCLAIVFIHSLQVVAFQLSSKSPDCPSPATPTSDHTHSDVDTSCEKNEGEEGEEDREEEEREEEEEEDSEGEEEEDSEGEEEEDSEGEEEEDSDGESEGEEEERRGAPLLPAKRGTEIRLLELQLSEGVGTVQCAAVKLVVGCTRCKAQQDVTASAER